MNEEEKRLRRAAFLNIAIGKKPMAGCYASLRHFPLKITYAEVCVLLWLLLPGTRPQKTCRIVSSQGITFQIYTNILVFSL
jgi:phosphoglycerol transferase MdoB-like AlkP superfamily enzyme